MHRAALRPAARAFCRNAASPASRRLASTSPVDRPRSWKSSALRWGLAGGALYYYSTSNVFAEEPQHLTSPPPSHFSDEDLPTVDSVIESKRQQIQSRLESQNVTREARQSTASSEVEKSKQLTSRDDVSPEKQQDTTGAAPAGSPAALEEEAGQQGAFNPETGEINWDCPCLGGMADGPCGEQFKTAFSCFVYSDAEPKGMDCIDKFQGMQDCFREHPEIYGAEIADDEAAVAEGEAEQYAEEHAAKTAAQPDVAISEPDVQKLRDAAPESTPTNAEAAPASLSTPAPESDPFPSKWDDATAANDAVEKVKTPQEKEEETEPEKKKEGGRT